MDPEVYAELENQIRQLSEMVSLQTAAMSTMGKAIEESYTAINNLNSGEKKYNANQAALNQASAKNLETMNARDRAIAQADKERKTTQDALNVAMEGAGSALNNLGTAILSTQQGFTKYNSTINTVGNTAWEVGKNFGLLGIAVGGLTNIFAKLLQYETKRLDVGLAVSDSFQKMGAVNAMSVKQIRDMGRGAGLSSTELEKMVKPMQSVKGGFLSLGKTQAEGVKAFGEMINANESVRRSFLKLGLGDQDRIQMSADFVEYLNESGQSVKDLAKTKGALARASLNYTKQVYELSGLTGADIETTKKKLSASANNNVVALYNADFEIKKRKLQEKIYSNLPEAERAAAKRELDNLERKKEAFETLKNGLMAANVSGDMLAGALATSITGAVNEQSKSLVLMGFPVTDITKGLENGNLSIQDVTAKFVEAQQDTVERLGPIAALNKEIGERNGLMTETLRFSAQRAPEQIRSAVIDTTVKLNDLFRGKGAVGADPAQKARGDLIEAERKARFVIDDVVDSLLKNLKLLAAAAVTAAVALSLASAGNGMPDLGKRKPGGGGGGGGGGGFKGTKKFFRRLFNPKLVKRVVQSGIKSLLKPSNLLKMSKGLLGGVGALAGGLALDIGSDYAKKTGHTKLGAGLSAGSAALTGAGFGATVGSIVPGLGTLVGAAVGGAIGGAFGLWSNRKELLGDKKPGDKKQEKPQPPNAVNALKIMLDQVALLQTYTFDIDKIDNNSQALGLLFEKGGLLESFRKFAKEDFGPNASKNADSFLKYAQARATIAATGGVVTAPGAQTGPSTISRAVGAAGTTIGDAASAAGQAATGFVDWAKAKMTGKPTDVLNFTGESGQYENFAALNPDMQRAVIAAATDYKKATGKKMRVNSARRAVADQERLWAESVALGTPGRGPGGMLVGKPPRLGGNPPHLRGNAIDLQEGKSDPTRAIPILAKYGLTQTYGGKDPVHFDLKASDGGIFSGPDLGYPIEMHGSEMIAPLDPNSLLMKLAKTQQTERSSGSTMRSDLESQVSLNVELYAMINEKVDTMTRILENSQDKHSKMLQAARV